MRVVVQHRSRYHYPRPALLGPQLIRLRPADHTRARIERYRQLWDARFDELDQVVEELKRKESVDGRSKK